MSLKRRIAQAKKRGARRERKAWKCGTSKKGARRPDAAWALLAFLLLTACGTVWTPVLPPVEPPPPVVAPPVDPPPPVTPPEAPVPVSELVARLATGSTVAEAEEVMGRPADNIAPAHGPAPETRRWFVKEAGQTWAVYAVMRNGKVSGAGSARVVEVK